MAPTDNPPPDEGPLQEGRDFTVENGLFVFTRAYLERRGTCCESGCLNCPWDFRSTSGK